MSRIRSFRFSFLAVVFISFSVFVAGGAFNMFNNKPQHLPGDKYTQEWKVVDSLDKIGMYTQASKKVDVIYAKAKQNKNTAQIVKTIIYKLKYKNTIEDNSSEEYIKYVDTEIGTADETLKAILYSIKAELVWHVYQNNMWQINERTPTDQNEKMDSWDAQKFMDETRRCYMLSLKNEALLKNIPIEDIADILKEDSISRPFRPTLFDFLAHRALDHFMNSQSNLNKPVYAFELDEPVYFNPASEFIRLNIATQDSLSSDLFTIRLFKSILSFHIKSGNKAALIDADLKRLQYVYDNYSGVDKDNLYLQSLLALDAKYKSETAEVKIRLAEKYNEWGQAYAPQQGETERKYYKKKAVALCEDIIQKYPTSISLNRAKNLLNEIKKPWVSAVMEYTLTPDVSNLMLLDFENIDKAYFNIVSVKYEDYKNNQDKSNEVFGKWLTQQKSIRFWTQNLLNDDLYHKHNAEVEIGPLNNGFYVLMVHHTNDFSANSTCKYIPFFVSNLTSIKRNASGTGMFETIVVDRNTGLPVKGAEVSLYKRVYNYGYKNELQTKLITNNEGRAVYNYSSNSGNNFIYTIKTKDDFFADDDYLYLYNYGNKINTTTKTTFFTDRAIYRPGQTVYFKGIKIKSDGSKNGLVTNTNTDVFFKDANYQEISRIKLAINDYGSFQGSFVIPQGLSTGSFTIGDQHGSKQIQVEEYKRPKFEVTVQKPTDVFRVNDQVKIKGNAKALAGFNITGAKVQYRVYRTANFPIWYRSWFPMDLEEQEITFGKTVTDDNGEFSITFQALPDKMVLEGTDPIFNYRVNVEITDDAGETRTAEETISAGYKTITVSASLPKLINGKQIKPWNISVKNLNGHEQKQPVSVKVERLQKTNVYREKLWDKPDVFLMDETEFKKKFPLDIYKNEESNLLIPSEEVVYNGIYNTGDTMGFKDLNNLKSGLYRTIITAKDTFGKETKSVYVFTVYNENEKKSPVNTFFEANALQSVSEPGTDARFHITSSKNIKVLYEIEHDRKIIKREVLSLKNEQKIVSIPILPEYRGNIHVSFTAIYQGRNYLRSFTVTVPYTNKQLRVKLESYRDKMLPGSTEEWKINVSPILGERETAELLLGMYDASLDAFVKNDWFLSVWQSRSHIFSWRSSAQKVKNVAELNYEYSPYFDETYIKYEQLNWFGFNLWSIGSGYRNKAIPEEADGSGETYRTLEESNVREESTKDKSVAFVAPAVAELKSNARGGDATEKEETRNTGVAASVKSRSNFSETAFFYPQIKTDEKGNAIFSFTMPESLTKWKLMGLAHTKSLQIGTITQEVVTQKELMINTFAPRFLREGDELIFTGKITNLTEKELTGEAVLELTDPLNDKNIASDFDLNKVDIPFSVKPGQSVPVEWKIKIPFNRHLVRYSVKAVSQDFSDGEENVLPILTNRMLVTETVTLWVNGNDTKNFTLPKLNAPTSTMRNHKLTLEFTSNPAWYAVQSLPYLMEYPYECAEQTFSRLYANSIAMHIANSDPKIKKVFETWRDYESQALESKLQKNQDLKNIMLEETPWVREANNEQERKRRIGILFDINRMKNELKTTEKKLFDMQSPNGGFPWFKGGPDDRYITQYIVTGFGKLRRLGIDNYDAKLYETLYYLDSKIKDDYKDLIKFKVNLNQDNINHIQIQYLYARSFFKHVPVDDENKKEVAYYFSQAEKYWMNKDDYSQGMLALVMQRADKKTLAKQMIASLKDRSIYNEELGMYWKGMLQGGYYWYNAPIETTALMIEAFDEVSNDIESVNAMRRWLLKNKQTNDWKTTKATADASYALLLKGTDLLSTDAGIEISFGKNAELPFDISSVKAEAGTGYLKKDFAKEEIKSEMGNIRVTKKTTGPGYGAMYWQYFEDMDKITKPTTPNPMSVSKKLFREVKTANGLKLEEINNRTKLETGDRIISRIIFNSDRPMEYVHLKDMRASGLEPENVISQYKWKQGLGYYESTRDVATHFFISYVPRGTFVFEYPSRVTHKGEFSNGITQIQCMYAPEFTFHSEGIRLTTR